MKLQTFLKKRPYLLWHVKDYNQVSPDAVVEAVLNYGDFPDVKEMIKILGIKKTAQIFQTQTTRTRSNYNPKIKKYFDLYFAKYA